MCFNEGKPSNLVHVHGEGQYTGTLQQTRIIHHYSQNNKQGSKPGNTETQVIKQAVKI